MENTESNKKRRKNLFQSEKSKFVSKMALVKEEKESNET